MEGSGGIESGRVVPSSLPIVQYWDAEPPPGYIADLLQTFGDLNPGMPSPGLQRIPPAGQGRLFRGPKRNVINGVFAFGSPGHPFLELALEIATANIERRLCDRVYFTTGPPIFATLVRLHRLGSFDALIAHSKNSVFEEFAKPYCEAIGDYGRVSRAFEGIEVCAAAAHSTFIRDAGIDLPYKRSDLHWTQARIRT